jgi:threonine/homoserine/homoserine lactone efflux protein
MEGSVFLRGLLLGFSIAAPVGPIGVLCIRRTLGAGFISGIVSGLGAALADSLYGAVAAFGLTALSGLLLTYSDELRLGGGLFLLYLGGKTFIARPAALASGSDAAGRLRDFSSALFLTLTNPMTILSFTAIFAGLGFGGEQSGIHLAGWLVGGVFSGSLLWWVLLSSLVGRFRHRFDSTALRLINRASGIILVWFGFISLFSLQP